MKSNLLILFSVFLVQILAHAHGGQDQGGGGDICEKRIQTIRDDLSSWIEKGGPKGLVLSQDFTVEKYSSSMQDEITKAKIRCVEDGDPGHPVQVDGTPKICRFDKNKDLSLITCDFSKFQSVSESDQYVLIHHEYASLAGLEKPNGDQSTYAISNQLVGFLLDQTEKKLAIKPAPPSNIPMVVVSCKDADKNAKAPVVFEFRLDFTQLEEGLPFFLGQTVSYSIVRSSTGRLTGLVLHTEEDHSGYSLKADPEISMEITWDDLTEETGVGLLSGTILLNPKDGQNQPQKLVNYPMKCKTTEVFK